MRLAFFSAVGWDCRGVAMMVSTMVELSDLSLDISAALYSGEMMVSSLAGKSVSDSVSTLVAETVVDTAGRWVD